MSEDSENALALANRQTAADCALACENAARRTGRLLVETIILFDGDPAEYRDMMIEEFDKAVTRNA